MNKEKEINNNKNKYKSFQWYVPHYTPSLPQQAISFKQILNKVLRELLCLEKCVFMKKVTIQSLWNFETRTQEGMIVPNWINSGFTQSDKQESFYLNVDTFFGPPVKSAHCIITIKKHPDGGIYIIYDDDYYSQGYGRIKELIRALTKDDVLQPYMSDSDFRYSKEGNDTG